MYEPVHYVLVGNNKQGFRPEAESPADQHTHAIARNLLVFWLLWQKIQGGKEAEE